MLKVEAKNSLETYAFKVRNSINDEKVKSRLPPGDRKTIDGAVDAALKWLEGHNEAGREEFEKKQKELESTVRPLRQKLYSGGGAGSEGTSGSVPPCDPGGGAGSVPIDEVSVWSAGESVGQLCGRSTSSMSVACYSC